jgi:adenine deaminase
MMNYPGVIFKDNDVLDKIEAAKTFNKPVDGHAPGLRGDDLKVYANAGINTDHECATLAEALEKIGLGMKILIREGSSAKNFDALYSLLTDHSDVVMLCSDDLHADDLIMGHMDLLVKRALERGIPLFNVLNAVSLNPVLHYNLPVGLLRSGDLADFLIVDNLTDLTVEETWINGELVFGPTGLKSGELGSDGIGPNNFHSSFIKEADLNIVPSANRVKVIKVEEGSILTGNEVYEIGPDWNKFLSQEYILKLFVKDRYLDSGVSKALVKGFGPMRGAIVSTVAHDSHNIIALGDDVRDIARAMNMVIENRGGIAFVSGSVQEFLPLPIGGLMSKKPAEHVANQYERIINLAQEHGCVLKSPLMTLSFLALPVIPSLKLSDKGLFDVDKFTFTDLFF